MCNEAVIAIKSGNSFRPVAFISSPYELRVYILMLRLNICKEMPNTLKYFIYDRKQC